LPGKLKNHVVTKSFVSRLGIYVADIPCSNSKGKDISFTFFWKQANHWENKNFEIKVEND